MSPADCIDNADFQRYWQLSPESRRQKLQDASLPVLDRAILLFQTGLLLAEAKEWEQAIASYDAALELQPDYEYVWLNRGIALHNLKLYAQAIFSYDKVLGINPNNGDALIEKSHCLRNIDQFKAALEVSGRAVKANPNSARAWAINATMLAFLGKNKQALASSDRAIAINPNYAEAWNSKGLALSSWRRYQQAIAAFDRAIEIQPDFGKAWYNRGIMLLQLNRNREALETLNRALEIPAVSSEYWYHQLLYACGSCFFRLGNRQQALNYFDKALAVKPNFSPAAWLKVMCVIFTGKLSNYLMDKNKRERLGQEFKIGFHTVGYRLLFLALAIAGIIFSSGSANVAVRQGFSILFSFFIIWVIAREIWRNKSNLGFIFKVYFQSGILSYVRAFGIMVITIGTMAIVTPYVPGFLRWGWGSSLLGTSGNIIFQPLDTFRQLRSAIPDASNTFASTSLTLTASSAIEPSSINYEAIFIGSFWLLLIAAVPFLARWEEKVFRQGANTWKQIIKRSIAFGLVHFTAGIPLYACFVLIIPGMLFGWRYKYARDRCFKATGDEWQAQEAGVAASTADHAIYNALLITLLLSVFFLASLN